MDTKLTLPDDMLVLALTEQREDARWEIISVLQARLDCALFERAVALCRSENAVERCLGVDLLAQGQMKAKLFHNEVVTVFLDMLADEQDANVLYSLGMATGHRGDPRTIPLLIQHRSHPDADVRYSVVFGLLTHEDSSAVNALIELSADADDDVRDWATFGLGTQIDTDTPTIRDALAARLRDDHDDTRSEALIGLACRRDKRVIEPLIHELLSIKVRSNDDEIIGTLAIEAAEAIADTRLCPALQELRAWAAPNDAWLDGALKACGCERE